MLVDVHGAGMGCKIMNMNLCNNNHQSPLNHGVNDYHKKGGGYSQNYMGEACYTGDHSHKEHHLKHTML